MVMLRDSLDACDGVAGFMMKSSTAGEEDSRFAIRPECQGDVPKTHFKPRVSSLSFYSLLYSIPAMIHMAHITCCDS